ncbi:equilibrative nucleoside transporter [Nesidiocoris tenuis]|uniref:Equilibrative nucleoside transporter n=1 Tax=Nesidiocoris tenuis TaxID=355587 RepID=A0ABN7BF81_9HEMI|nr:equilibrative nucleoside transporter [Nesidiocoris tenuis]
MDENLSRGYIQLGKARGVNDLRFTNGFSHLSPPIDKYDGIYYSLVLAGVGFLLPYNSFIIAVDYFQTQYPGTTIVFDMSLVYIVMAFFAVLANNLLVEALSLNTRITFGYIVSFFTLLFVAIFEVLLGIIPQTKSYTANLIAVAVVALGCTVQQSSFYGYTSMLPSRYTQAVMAGESAAGLLVSVNRILTKMLLNDQRINTLIFFTVSMLIVGLCFGIHQVVRQTDFVQFYLTLCKEAKKITLEPTEDAGLMDPVDQTEGKGSQYGVLKLQPQSPIDSTSAGGHFSFSNPVYEPSATTTTGTTTYKVEDVVVSLRSGSTSSYRRPSSGIAWSSVQKGMKMRWEVAKNIWPSMIAIAITYLVTLSLYPGIESEIISCKFGSWMPVILMAVFNASDLMGKMSASLVYDWSRFQLCLFGASRVVLIPALLMCAWPREKPFFIAEGYAIFFSIVLGLTNGVIGSVPMIQAPSRVSEQHRELTGNIMTLSYNFGLTAGSLVAYVFEALLGPPLFDPCGFRHIQPLAYNTSTYFNQAATTVAAAVVTTLPTTRATLPATTTMLMTTLATTAAPETTTLLTTLATAAATTVASMNGTVTP